MSLKLMNIILFFTIFLFKFIKNEEDQLENNNQPLRFLVDEKSSKIAYTKFKYEPEEYNLIDRVRTTFNGDSTYNGENIYTKANVGEAYIQGVEGNISYKMSKTFSIITNYSIYSSKPKLSIPIF